MAHRSSASALHTARMVLKFYALTVRTEEQMRSGVRPITGLLASEAHLSIIIDKATNAFEIAKLRPQVAYWMRRLRYEPPTSELARQMGFFIRTLVVALELIPQDKLEHPAVSTATGLPVPEVSPWSVISLSRFAILATRAIWQYYTVMPLNPNPADSDYITQLELTRLIDVSLGLRKAVKAIPILRSNMAMLADGSATPGNIKACMRATGVLLEYLPNYEEREEEVKLLV